MRHLQGETYRWALCKEALPMTEMRRLGIPLPAKHVDVLHASLSWEDFQVGPFIVERISAGAGALHTMGCLG